MTATYIHPHKTVHIDNLDLRLVPSNYNKIESDKTARGLPIGPHLVSLSFNMAALDILYGEINEGALVGIITGTDRQPPDAERMMQYSGISPKRKSEGLELASRLLATKVIYQPGLANKPRPGYPFGYLVSIEGDTSKLGAKGVVQLVYDKFLNAIGYTYERGHLTIWQKNLRDSIKAR